MKLKISKLTTLATFFLGVCLLPTGCSDDFNPPETPVGETIADIVAENTDLEIFEAALIKTGLISVFENPNAGKHTIFAPDDVAFLTYLQGVYAAATPPTDDQEAITKIQALTNSSSPLTIGALVARLQYHILGSEILSSQITGTQTFGTMSVTTNIPARISLSVVGSDILLNANTGTTGSRIITKDQEAINGVVHIIDKVMTVPSVATNVLSPFNLGVSYTTSPPSVTGTGGSETGGDGTGIDFDIFSYAVRKSGLAFTVVPNTSLLPDFTIFAPTDNAMRAYLGDIVITPTAPLENAAIATIKAMTDAQVADLVKYHILQGRYLSTDLSNGKVLNTLLTSKTITVSGDATTTITLQDNNAATDPNVTNSSTNGNGVVHTINGVLRAN